MKNVLITGANKGIGFQTARQLAELGLFVYIGSRQTQKGLQAEEQLKDAGLSNVASIELDVTNPESIKKAKARLEGEIDALDVLINNAGISGKQPQHISMYAIDDLREIFETNYFGAIQTTQLLLPLLRKSLAPSIINVSSEIGSLSMESSPNHSPNWDNFQSYGSTKTALNAFTVLLSNELSKSNFCVNSVTPGYTATDLNQFQGFKTAEQGAKAIVKLATSADRGITGKFFKDEGEIPW